MSTYSPKERKEIFKKLNHDLSSVMHNITNLNELIIEETEQDSDSDLSTYTGFIQKTCNVLKSKIQLMSDFHLIEEIHNPLNTSIDDIFQKVIEDDLADEIKSKSAQIVKTKALGSFTVSTKMMAKLLKELVSNAITFNSSDTPTVKVTSNMTQTEFQICITDNGVGFPAKFNLLEMPFFFQGNRRLHSSGNGSNLTICKKIMEYHGGNMKIKTSTEKGSSITCNFPLNITKQEI